MSIPKSQQVFTPVVLINMIKISVKTVVLAYTNGMHTKRNLLL